MERCNCGGLLRESVVYLRGQAVMGFRCDRCWEQQQREAILRQYVDDYGPSLAAGAFALKTPLEAYKLARWL